MTTGVLAPRGDATTRVAGKFLEVAGARFLVKGVSYGTFAPDAAGAQFPPLSQVDADFGQMARAGFNTVRTYTVPPEQVMDAAAAHGLRVMVGVPWSQHVAFLGDRALSQQIRREAVDAVKRLSRHPAALLFALGNEIPPGVVRWHGAARVEAFLRSLCRAVKNTAPDAILTYVNFPPTEYLDLDSFDVCAFNVYLHRKEDLRAYLARLQHVAGYRPFLLAEAGADSIREGPDGQAEITAMHVRTAFEEGACGVVAYSWTDEWWRGGETVRDWAFGLVDATRTPKPALAAAARAFEEAPFPPDTVFPRVSVVVCAYNAADTLEECLTSLEAQDYPDYEIIVVNDGSRDGTGEIARRFSVRLIEVPNGGLSAARNLGLAHATGEIVAYTDADVRADRDWLKYLVRPMVDGAFVGSGGPNVVPPEDPWVAQCVARAPGGPTHVLLDDRVAEHVPGCNMAFRRDVLAGIGGFNPVYLRAGDDVDVCWRLQAKGHRIGFAPSALVWHHHRSSVKAYWRQQVGYGEGETWLDAHHPEKFIGGQMLWHGRIYSPLPFIRSLTGRRVNTGVWGLAAFPSVYRTDPHAAQFLPHTPAWMLISLGLCVSGVLLTPYPALGWVLLLTGLTGWATTIGRCVQFARRTDVSSLPALPGRGRTSSRRRYRALIAWLHFIQPIARIYGRLRGMWSPPAPGASEHMSRVPWKAPLPSWREVRTALWLLLGARRERSFWTERWLEPPGLLTELAGVLRASRPAPGVEVDDGWRADRDMALTVGGWGRLHVRTLIEEHAAGRCLVRIGANLRLTFVGAIKTAGLVGLLLAAMIAAVLLERPVVREVATAVVVLVFGRALWKTARAFALLDRALGRTAGVLELTALGRPRAPWMPSVSWRPLAVAPLAQAAVLLAVVASTSLTTSSVVERVRAHLPFGSGAAVATVPLRTGMLSAGSVAVAASGEIVFADAAEGTIRRLRVSLLEAPRGPEAVEVLANSVLAAGGASVAFPDAADVALAPNGDVYVADAANHRVCRIDRQTGAITTIAGDGSAGFDGDGGQAVRAALASPSALAVAPNGDLYIADTGNHRIRVLSARTGIITTVAGGGTPTDAASGAEVAALSAVFARPSGVAVTQSGDVYVSDTGHGEIRRIDGRTGMVSTIVGRVHGGGVAESDALLAPTGMALAPTGTGILLYVADEGSGAVRVVGMDGTVTTLKAPRAFVRPSRLAFHPVGWLLVMDASADGLTAVRVPQGRATLATRSRRATVARNVS